MLRELFGRTLRKENFRSSYLPARRFARLNLTVLEGREVPSQITNFTYAMNGNSCTITGQVVDLSPGDVTVTLGGTVPGISGQQVTTNGDGFFQITVTLPPGTPIGLITGQAIDPSGVASPVAEIPFTN
jgi:hypothetical protein